MSMYVAPNDIAQARQMDALTYLQRYEPNELVRIGTGNYTTKTHDSLKIKRDGRWYWWSRRTGGHTAIDYLIAVKGMSLPEAVYVITGKGTYRPPRDKAVVQYAPPVRAAPQGEFELPPPHDNNKRVFAYLLSRGIDPEIINHCFKHNLLYEDAEHHNAVFVGYDNGGTAKYATMRSTLTQSTFLRDVDFSDKSYSFLLKSNKPNEVLYLFECAIDALSFATLLKTNGREWRDYSLLSLGGVYKQREQAEETVIPAALDRYLKDNAAISRIILCLDNDDIGRGAAVLIQKLLPDKEIKNYPPPQGKDYNEYLHICKGITSKAAMRISERRPTMKSQ